MKALTLWQPWASLIVAGAKPIEWRHWRLPERMIGQRIVIHAAARPIETIEVRALQISLIREGRQILAGETPDRPTSMDVEKALRLLTGWSLGRLEIPVGVGVGTAVLGTPALAADLGFAPGSVGLDSDRLEKQNWGWPLAAVEMWDGPIRMRGRQSFWNWPSPSDFLDDDKPAGITPAGQPNPTAATAATVTANCARPDGDLCSGRSTSLDRGA